ncbi:MAG: right-handed parallel beta-helix repeat-containing protein [Lentisphaerae bacterium]|jgi:hypothetical protein|nr:right-handed parallel beta-helix repeat-containing protein [Lentisphaerota bacterium]MBT4823147.1 right-handed parallel beta-helix repeat-containing protein [Lentisphaerota bacterium]MBT5610465.1 right-handed parallel beta-helix repeat-containing protein [Lentisphaerota bacterium]MBT7061056.1 right-handed parallel beta-helix repeat-containing protein [Lentisphaerota bacterium]MBT7842159.1 right-handed parallel beta-helix repeat-containing protein [Lentisphaerota bacterium]
MDMPYPGKVMEFFVSPLGRDTWSGTLKEPSADETDGPFASIKGAQTRLRYLKTRPPQLATPHTVGGIAGPIVVWLRGGRYPVQEPVVFGPEDSLPVTYAAYPGETPIIDGGVRITGWETTEVNGRTAWVAALPEVAEGTWHFRQLFVDGKRRSRPRFPREGLFRMADVPGMPLPAGWQGGGYTQFACADGDVAPYRNLSDIEVVYVHFWIEERSPIASFEAETNMVTMARESRTCLVGSHGSQLADYYLDNVFEAMTEPGDWYLDREKGDLYYLPLPGETPETTEVFAPRALQLLRLSGRPERDEFVEHVRFHGLTFQHTDWRHPGENEAASLDAFTLPSGMRLSRGNHAAAGQAASDVPGIVNLRGGRNCAFEDCVVRNGGWYGVVISEGCSGIRVVGNELVDLGAGGVKMNGAAAGEPDVLRTRLNRVTDNHIHKAGRVFHSAVGVLAMNTAENVIAHNHIHDLYYSGISSGWVWGYAASTSHDNIIEKNHIHHIGQGLLSDMGGVYLLSVQPGTVVRGNLIHDVEKAHYGGWALYTDEGSSHIILENNVCYNTNGHLFHQHYGRENVVRNNILVFGDEAMAAYTRIEPHIGLTYMRNIVVSRGAPMFHHGYGENERRILSDLNLYWDVSRTSPVLNADGKGENARDLASWRALGHDPNSVVADPKFADLENRDFTLAEDSPALALGFVPIDLSDVGPRPPEDRE